MNSVELILYGILYLFLGGVFVLMNHYLFEDPRRTNGTATTVYNGNKIAAWFLILFWVRIFACWHPRAIEITANTILNQ